MSATEPPRAGQGERRCPNCRALVSEDATWCGQCFSSLDDPGPEPAVATEPTVAAGPMPPPPAGEEGRVAGWPCPVCEGRNPLSADACETCGTPFATLMRTEPERPEVDPRRAVLWSLVFPGLGHRLIGRAMDGFARGVLFAICLGMTVLAITTEGGGGAATGILVLFGATGLAVYVLSAVEVGRLARGGDVIVSSRTLLWALVGVVFLSVTMLAMSVIGAARR